MVMYAVDGQPLSVDELRQVDAYWRAANYLAVGQIYLVGNPLLREPLAPEHVKPRLLGHWGTTPGLNLLYAHLSRVIAARGRDLVFITGPGHGGPGLVANAWLEGTYTETYPHISRDGAGMGRLFTQFSFPGGIPSDQVIELAAAADHAQQAEVGDPSWQAELAYWTGGTRPTGTGIPDSAIPDESSQTTVPGRDFGHSGDLAISAAHDLAAVFAILHGASDERRDWIRAGEALSAGWLTATELGISVLPHSAPVEVIGTRDTLRRILAYLYHPYLVVRLGTVDAMVSDPPHAPRLPADQTIDRL
jgi:hypothetical protein